MVISMGCSGPALPKTEMRAFVRTAAILIMLSSLLALPAPVVAEQPPAEEGSEQGSEDESTDDAPSTEAGDQGEEKPEADSKSEPEAEPEPEPQPEPEAEPQPEPQPADSSAVAAPPADAQGQGGEQPEATDTSAQSGESAASSPGSAGEREVQALDPTMLQTLRLALDQVAVLQIMLVEAHQGDGPIRGHDELNDVRRALQDALLEVARMQQEITLRQWLEAEGHKEVAASGGDAGNPGRGTDDAATEAEAEAETEAEDAAISAARLQNVKRAIEDAPFKEGKLQVLTEQLENVRLRTEQVAELVELFAFSRDKVEALVFLYPRIVDPERFEELLSSLKFASDKMTVRQRLGLKGS